MTIRLKMVKQGQAFKLSTGKVERIVPASIDILDRFPNTSENIQKWMKLVLEYIDPKKLPKGMRPFQRHGVYYAASRQGRVLFGDEMGLGKTCQAASFLAASIQPVYPTLVVCPATIKDKWKDEIHKWNPDAISIILSSTKQHPLFDSSNRNVVYIINYDILDSWLPMLNKLKPRTIIFDECHYIKNMKAIRSKRSKVLAKKATFVMGLSGTPITSRPKEFFNILYLLKPKRWPYVSRGRYAKRYCGRKQTIYGYDDRGASHTDELNKLVRKHVMIRRLKKDVLKQLPDKTRTLIKIDLGDKFFSQYYQMEKDIVQWVRQQRGKDASAKAKRGGPLSKLNELLNFTLKHKTPYVLNWVQNFLDGCEDKLIIFVNHHVITEAIRKKFKNVLVLDGSTPMKERWKIQNIFNKNKSHRLLVASMANGAKCVIGMDLTGCNYGLVTELPWNPYDMDQATDRMHRIGQTKKVFIYCLLTKDTVEEDIYNVSEKVKRKVLTEVLDGGKYENKGFISEIFRHVGNRKRGNKRT